jgi:hypothetical protein
MYDLLLHRDLVEYTSTTSTGVLREHIGKFHSTEYVKACKKHGWEMKLKATAG